METRNCHYVDNTRALRGLISPEPGLFVQYHVRVNSKEHTRVPLWGESTGDGAFLTKPSNATESIHYSDVILNAVVYQITSVSIVYSTICSGADQGKHQSSTLPVTAQRASYAENVSIWWRHHIHDLFPGHCFACQPIDYLFRLYVLYTGQYIWFIDDKSTLGCVSAQRYQFQWENCWQHGDDSIEIRTPRLFSKWIKLSIFCVVSMCRFKSTIIYIWFHVGVISTWFWLHLFR